MINNNFCNKFKVPCFLTYYLLLFISAFSETIVASESINNIETRKDDPVKIITFGHSYPILDTEEKRNEFIKHINDQKVDYVVILGDSDLESISVAKNYLDNLNTVLLSVPGNHDVQENELKKRYLHNIGYLDKTLIEDKFNFILINSSENYNNINDNLNNSYEKIKNNNPTILFTHHRIWDDNFLGKKPYNSFKSYKFKQLNIGLNSKIDYIISGNNPAHYFGNSARIKNNIVNHNIIFWSDIVNGIKCYNIGMAGSGGVKVPERNIATYLLIEISNNGVNIIPSEYKLKHSNNLEYKLKHFNKININDLQNIQDTDLDVIFNYIMFRIKSKTFIAGFTIGIIFILFIFILHKIIRTKSKY